uniref:Uncharacterized protein n=1 Tax=Oryza brachyantha TaxID=4533 RepID=J3MFJ2_ORYBR
MRKTCGACVIGIIRGILGCRVRHEDRDEEKYLSKQMLRIYIYILDIYATAKVHLSPLS